MSRTVAGGVQGVSGAGNGGDAGALVVSVDAPKLVTYATPPVGPRYAAPTLSKRHGNGEATGDKAVAACCVHCGMPAARWPASASVAASRRPLPAAERTKAWSWKAPTFAAGGGRADGDDDDGARERDVARGSAARADVERTHSVQADAPQIPSLVAAPNNVVDLRSELRTRSGKTLTLASARGGDTDDEPASQEGEDGKEGAEDDDDDDDEALLGPAWRKRRDEWYAGVGLLGARPYDYDDDDYDYADYPDYLNYHGYDEADGGGDYGGDDDNGLEDSGQGRWRRHESEEGEDEETDSEAAEAAAEEEVAVAMEEGRYVFADEGCEVFDRERFEQRLGDLNARELERGGSPFRSPRSARSQTALDVNGAGELLVGGEGDEDSNDDDGQLQVLEPIMQF